MKTALYFILFLTAQILVNTGAYAHSEGEDYVFINFQQNEMTGEFQINLDDLQEKLNIPIPDDKTQADIVVQETASQVHSYIRENFSISPSDTQFNQSQNNNADKSEAQSAKPQPYNLTFLEASIFSEADDFARYTFIVENVSPPDVLNIRHNMFYENDLTHRGLFLVQYNVKTDTDYGPEHTALIFSQTNSIQQLDLHNIPGLMERTEMFYQGMLHIWIGIDHILFILALILSTVLIRKSDHWIPVPRAWPAFKTLLGIITIFTIAHSITLILAALDFIAVNARWVETIIALSIVLVGLNNIFSPVKRGSLYIIFALGLFHGLGFASVMGNLPFRMEDLVKVVIRFNIGVEIGQVVIVALIFPILYCLRKQSFYVPVVLKGGSGILVIIASWWAIQRAFL